MEAKLGGSHGLYRSSLPTKSDFRALESSLKEKDEVIDNLRKELVNLRMCQKRDLSNTSSTLQNPRTPPRSPRRIIGLSYQVEDDGVLTRQRVGRLASLGTARAISNFPIESADDLATKMIDIFKKPIDKVEYLHSTKFATDLLQICGRVRKVFEDEPRCLSLPSPCYVLGDIHGNMEDLTFFADNLWKLGMNLSAGKFLFLGDYVDRGLLGLECVAYLFSLKILSPQKIYLLRGNHETRDVNGWIEHYGDRSFLYQCTLRFGEDLGNQIWEQVNQVFDRLPLAAVIDNEIFCVHGGFPRPSQEMMDNYLKSSTTSNKRSLISHSITRSKSYNSSINNNDVACRVEEILNLPKIASISPPLEHESDEYIRIASDCIWSDPAPEEYEKEDFDSFGFGESLRGGGAVCFGHDAVDKFLNANNLSYIVRAHEAHSEGVGLSKNARVFTVFSTSKDHGQGAGATAGCILVDDDSIRVINRSVKYKNKFVHRRQSACVTTLPSSLIEKGIQMGLVINTENDHRLIRHHSDVDTDSEDDDSDYEEEGKG